MTTTLAERPANASAEALALLSPLKLGKQAQAIFDVIVAAQRRREREDFSLTEVRDLFERLHGRRIDVSRVSARVSELVSAGRLVRISEQRKCSVTGAPCRPVSVPPAQARLCA